MGVKPLHVSFDKMDGFIKIYDGTRYLVSFGPERYNGVYDRIRYLTIEKSGIKYRISHNFTRIRIDLYNPLPIEKTLMFQNFIILIKSVINKNKNNCY